MPIPTPVASVTYLGRCTPMPPWNPPAMTAAAMYAAIGWTPPTGTTAALPAIGGVVGGAANGTHTPGDIQGIVDGQAWLAAIDATRDGNGNLSFDNQNAYAARAMKVMMLFERIGLFPPGWPVCPGVGT